MKIGLFAGSFDPFTIGHADIVKRSLDIFDEVHILISNNLKKTRYFPHEIIKNSLEEYYKDNEKVKVFVVHDRITDFNLPDYEYSYLIRGIRDSADFDYEKQLTIINKELTGLDSMFLMTNSAIQHISSSFVRELMKYNKEYEQYII